MVGGGKMAVGRQARMRAVVGEETTVAGGEKVGGWWQRMVGERTVGERMVGEWMVGEWMVGERMVRRGVGRIPRWTWALRGRCPASQPVASRANRFLAQAIGQERTLRASWQSS